MLKVLYCGLNENINLTRNLKAETNSEEVVSKLNNIENRCKSELIYNKQQMVNELSKNKCYEK